MTAARAAAALARRRTTTAARRALPPLGRLAGPIFVEQLLHVGSGVVATLMVSQLSDAAVAGLGSAARVLWMLMLVFGAVATGAVTLISHRLGQNDREGALRLARCAVAASLWLGLALGLILLPLAAPLLHWIQLPETARHHALPYLQWMVATLFLESMNFGLSAALRAHGFTRAVMLIMALQNLINAAGVACMLNGPWAAMTAHAAGVAWASTASRLLACAALGVACTRLLGLRLRGRDLVHLHLSDVRRLLRFGLPATVHGLSWSAAFTVVTAMTAHMGTGPLATLNYVMQIVALVILFSGSVSQASELRVGRLVGAGERRAARSEGLHNLVCALMLATVASLAALLVGPVLLARFSTSPDVRDTGLVLLVLGLLLEPGRAFNLVLEANLRACGDMAYALRLGLLSHWVFMVGAGWLLGLGLQAGLPGVWVAFILDEWTRGLLLLRRWRCNRWLRTAWHSAQPRQAARTAASPQQAQSLQRTPSPNERSYRRVSRG